MPDPDSIADSRPWIAIGMLFALLLWETAHPFFRFPKGRERVRHGLRNLTLGILNAVVTSLVFVGLWWSASAWAEHHEFGLLHWLPLPTWAAWLLAILLLDAWTYMHKVHHSRWQPETDSNYSSLLSIWDRLFRSFRINGKPETIRLGLDEFDRPADQSIPGLLRTPIVKRKP